MALPDHLKRLLAECEVDVYRSSGPGGQHRNKTESSVRRLRHLPSGLVRVATEHRSQLRNRELALERLWTALEARTRKPRPRVATRPTTASRTRRLEGKRREAEKKRQRRSPGED